MESLFRCCLCVCGILPLLDADGTQHSSIIPDVTSRVCFFSVSLLRFILFFYSHSFFSYSELDGSRQVYNCTHTGHFILLLLLLYVSVHPLLLFFVSLSLSTPSLRLLISFFYVCLWRAALYYTTVAWGHVYCTHTHMEDDSFGPTLLSLFWFSKWNSNNNNNNSPIILRICTTRLLSRNPMPLCRLLLAMPMSKAATEQQHSSHSIIIWFQSSWPFFLFFVILRLCGCCAWSVQSV